VGRLLRPCASTRATTVPSGIQTSTYQANGSFNWATFNRLLQVQRLRAEPDADYDHALGNPGSSTYGNPVTFTATVAHTSGTGAPTGTVTFSDGGTNLGTGTLDTSGNATFTTSTLSAARARSLRHMEATLRLAGAPPRRRRTLWPWRAQSTSVSSNSSSSTYGQSVTFTATVSPSAATGTVQFFDGATSLGTATLSGGRASVSTSTLACGVPFDRGQLQRQQQLHFQHLRQCITHGEPGCFDDEPRLQC